MPGKTKKEVYIAKTMADLNKFADVQPKAVGTNPRVLVKTTPKLLKQAEECDLMGDEEKAYILYMRFFNMVMIMKKTPDYKKDKAYYDSLVGPKNLLKAMDKAEELSKSLKDRYDYMEAKAVSDKLAQVDRLPLETENEADIESPRSQAKGKDNQDGAVKETTAKPAVPEEPVMAAQKSLTAMQLYSLLKNKDVEFVMMDVRKQAEFEESHIKHPSCISVPEEALPAGTTVTHIEKSLPAASKSLWRNRQTLDTIVLLDWESTLDKVTIGTTLRTLKDALFKYDSTVILKKEPVILEGGYDQWLSHYPMLTTNPKVSPPTTKTVQISSAPDLDFEYPDDEYFEDPKPPTVAKQPSLDQSDLSKHLNQFAGFNQSESLRQIPSVNGDAMPRVDRSTKPKPAVNQTVQDNKKDFTSFSNDTSLYPSVEEVKKPTNKVTENTDHRASTLQNADSGPGIESVSSHALSQYSEELEREKQELEEIRKQKAKELDSFHREKDRMSKERQARIERLKEEEKNLQIMEQAKKDQSRDLAELMRKKRRLQEEIEEESKAEEEEKLTQFEEENARKRELMKMQQDEAERQKRLDEVEKLRLERKKKEEENKKIQENEEALAQARERAQKEEEQKKLDLKRAADEAEKIRQEQARQKEKEARERARQETEAKEAEARIQQQREAKARQLEEEKQREADKQRLENERKAKEDREKQEKLRMEQALKLAEDKMRRMNDKPQVRTIPSPNLPVGWEKMWDKNTGRYFYVDHQNNTTQWEHPSAQQQVPPKDTFKTKLKDDSEPRSSGLKRSFSSPNIAQLLEEEAQGIKPTMPTVDRSKKPSQRVIEPRPLQMNRTRNLNPTYGNVGSALTGLRNLGNTCYMNSIIQCLNNTAPLIQYFLTDRYLYDINRESILGSHGEVADEFAVVVKALWQGQYRNITPRDFKYIVGKHQPMFAGHEQQDSQEFLTFLMDGLHEGLNKVKHRPKIPEQDNDRIPDTEAARIAWKNHCLLHDSVIVDLFQGQLKSTLSCLTCSKQSVTFQAFMYLSLPIPSGSRCSLQDCLRQFLKKESMTGSSRWKCPRCRVERDAEKKIDIWKLPKILIIALNRFVYEGMWRQKIAAYVDFPVSDLSLDKYVAGPLQQTHYQLYGVSNHYGTMDGGHYTAFCKNTCTKKWYKFDDHEVFEMSSSDVKTSAGFVLFYTSYNFTVPNYRQQF